MAGAFLLGRFLIFQVEGETEDVDVSRMKFLDFIHILRVDESCCRIPQVLMIPAPISNLSTLKFHAFAEKRDRWRLNVKHRYRIILRMSVLHQIERVVAAVLPWRMNDFSPIFDGAILSLK